MHKNFDPWWPSRPSWHTWYACLKLNHVTLCHTWSIACCHVIRMLFTYEMWLWTYLTSSFDVSVHSWSCWNVVTIKACFRYLMINWIVVSGDSGNLWKILLFFFLLILISYCNIVSNCRYLNLCHYNLLTFNLIATATVTSSPKNNTFVKEPIIINLFVVHKWIGGLVLLNFETKLLFELENKRNWKRYIKRWESATPVFSMYVS